MANVETIPAPDRIFIGGALIYATGDPVAVDVARRLADDGNWPGPKPERYVSNAERAAKATKTAKRAKKAPAENRAHQLREDRSK